MYETRNFQLITSTWQQSETKKTQHDETQVNGKIAKEEKTTHIETIVL